MNFTRFWSNCYFSLLPPPPRDCCVLLFFFFPGERRSRGRRGEWTESWCLRHSVPPPEPGEKSILTFPSLAWALPLAVQGEVLPPSPSCLWPACRPPAHAAPAPARSALSHARARGQLGRTSVQDSGDRGSRAGTWTPSGSPSPGFSLGPVAHVTEKAPEPVRPFRPLLPASRPGKVSRGFFFRTARHLTLLLSPSLHPLHPPPPNSLAPSSPPSHPPHRTLCTCSAACERARHVTPPNVALCNHVTQVRTRRSGV